MRSRVLLLILLILAGCNQPAGYLVGHADNFKRHFCQEPAEVRQAVSPELAKMGYDPDRLARSCP
jgi:hypothetical protein